MQYPALDVVCRITVGAWLCDNLSSIEAVTQDAAPSVALTRLKILAALVSTWSLLGSHVTQLKVSQIKSAAEFDGMTAIANVSRRELLRGAAVGSGLVLGLQLGLRPVAQAAETPNFAPNAFVSIDDGGQVTIIAHRAEMGQSNWGQKLPPRRGSTSRRRRTSILSTMTIRRAGSENRARHRPRPPSATRSSPPPAKRIRALPVNPQLLKV